MGMWRIKIFQTHIIFISFLLPTYVADDVPTARKSAVKPGRYCCAFGCSNHGYPPDPHHSYHHFPFDDPSTLQKWKVAVKRDNWKPSKSTVLCSDHFTPDCFIRPDVDTPEKCKKRVLLKKGSVPSEFVHSAPPPKKRNTRTSQQAATQEASSSSTIPDSGDVDDDVDPVVPVVGV